MSDETLNLSLKDRLRCWYKYDFLWKVNRYKEKFEMFVAWNLIPRNIRKWVIVRAFAEATGCDKSPDEVGYKEVYDTVDPPTKHEKEEKE